MKHNMTSGMISAGSSCQFSATRWSMVIDAGNWRASPSARRAMDELARQYWFPLYAFLRRTGREAQQAEDLVQGFLVHLLEHDALDNVAASQGKFRAFLLASLKNFAANEWDKSQTLKRGGQTRILSLDTHHAESRYLVEPVDLMTPDRLFERRWALTVLETVLGRLKAEYSANGKAEMFVALEHVLVGQHGETYAQIGEQMGMTDGAVKVAAHRLRRRYRDLLRDEILQTLSDPKLVQEEILELMKSL